MFIGKQRGKFGIKPHFLASQAIEAMFDAGGAPTLTGQYALHWLCSHLDRNDLLPFLDVAYPFIGENEDGNAINLINPSAFALTFNLTFNHVNGCKPPASGGSYADTGFTINSSYQNNVHACVYTTEVESTTNRVPIGHSTSNANRRFISINARNASNFPAAIMTTNTATNQAIGNIANVAGTFHGQRSVSNQQVLYMNGTKFTGATTSTTVSANSIYLFARNDADVAGAAGAAHTRARQGWASIGTAMSDAQAAQYSNLLTSYNNILARQWRG